MGIDNVVDIALRVNGTENALQIEPRVILLDALCEWLGLTGTKKGGDRGQCGAYPVIVAAVSEVQKMQTTGNRI